MANKLLSSKEQVPASKNLRKVVPPTFGGNSQITVAHRKLSQEPTISGLKRTITARVEPYL